MGENARLKSALPKGIIEHHKKHSSRIRRAELKENVDANGEVKLICSLFCEEVAETGDELIEQLRVPHARRH